MFRWQYRRSGVVDRVWTWSQWFRRIWKQITSCGAGVAGAVEQHSRSRRRRKLCRVNCCLSGRRLHQAEHSTALLLLLLLLLMQSTHVWRKHCKITNTTTDKVYQQMCTTRRHFCDKEGALCCDTAATLIIIKILPILCDCVLTK